MVLALYIIGAAVFIISSAAGFVSGSFTRILLGLAVGISSAIIFFALAKILENQESILSILSSQEEVTKKYLIPKKVCPKCNYTYDSDCGSCPNCGNRD